MTAHLNWRHEGDPVWDMEIETKGDAFSLTGSGSRLIEPDGAKTHEAGSNEYPLLYARMAELVKAGDSDTDLRPMEMVADAFLIGRRTIGDPFDW